MQVFPPFSYSEAITTRVRQHTRIERSEEQTVYPFVVIISVPGQLE
jgi:hypothetical protein